MSTVIDEAVATMEQAKREILQQRSRILALEITLNRFVLAHENLASETEGHYPNPDSGCIECTAGTVPDRYNTGLCAYHRAKQLLGQS